jgi:hypothetical protein
MVATPTVVVVVQRNEQAGRQENRGKGRVTLHVSLDTTTQSLAKPDSRTDVDR